MALPQPPSDESQSSPSSRPLARRDLFRGGAAGILGLGSLAGTAAGESGVSPSEGSLDPELTFNVEGTPFSTSPPLTPSDVQGPFWLNLALLRQNITEGLAGFPLRFLIQVVSRATRAPVPNAVVDLWHDDPDGAYSGFASEGTNGQTWLRGIQVTNAIGVVRFESIYPGWYTNRTAHAHVKINPNSTSELTTQLYFDDELSDRVYVYKAPYNLRGSNPTTNASDNFYDPRLETSLVHREGTPGLIARMRIVIA